MSHFDEIVDLFRQEASEHLAALEKGFLDLEGANAGEARGPIINELFRAAHSVKGAARAVELIDIQDCAQKLEETLDELRENPTAAISEAIERGLAQFDELRAAFDQWQPPQGSKKATEAMTPSAPVEVREDTFTVRVSSDRLDRMLSLAGELRISQRAADLHTQQLAALNELVKALPISDLRSKTSTKSTI
jgi:chemotaxis protein histidine kinase CheA